MTTVSNHKVYITLESKAKVKYMTVYFLASDANISDFRRNVFTFGTMLVYGGWSITKVSDHKYDLEAKVQKYTYLFNGL